MKLLLNSKRFLALLTVSAIIIGCSATERKKQFSESGWEKQVEQTRTQDLYAPHFKDGRYFTPWIKMRDKNFFDVLEWKLFHRTEYTKEENEFMPRVLPDTAARIKQTKGDFILWIGHNTFLIRINNTFWLTDPMFSKRALLPPRVTPPAITIAELAPIATNLNIVISHNHYDHLDADSMEKLPQNATVFVPLGLKETVMGMNKKKVIEMDWWQEKSLPGSAKLVCLPAQHWSMRIGQGQNRSLWAAWLLVTPDTTLYFGGDSGYFKGFREIGKKYPDIDYAFMATTAYHPRWFMYYQHMNVKEAVKGFEELGAAFFIPTQWATFPLGNEPPGYPGLDLGRHIQKNNLDPNKFKIMDIGQILPIQGK